MHMKNNIKPHINQNCLMLQNKKSTQDERLWSFGGVDGSIYSIYVRIMVLNLIQMWS